jgi:glycosyltransferase involved in cell wall biosynthesis
MIIMAYTAFNAASIGDALGAPEYSYWFVRRAFRPVLERFGIVVPVTDPQREVPAICASAAAHGQDCVFFSFEPPHKTVLGLPCRTIPVFAWEFDTIPDEAWGDDPRNDWRAVLAETGSAITHSDFSVAAIRRAMGQDYPAWSVPAPVYDANAMFAREAQPSQRVTTLSFSGLVIDSRLVDLELFSMSRSYSDGLEALRGLARYLREASPRTSVTLGGVVYTAVFNPIDGRKNFNDLLGGFLWAFRDVEDATLILKITHFDPVRGMMPVLADLAKHGRYKCRVLLLHGMLPDAEYRDLVRLTSYAVNASTNEGQCLPLMEFMSAGRPAISPAHTAMLNYIGPDNSFVVRHSDRLAVWPHDPRQTYRSRRHMVSVGALIAAYRESYAVAKHHPARYAAMSAAANAALKNFCSVDIAAQRLAEVLGVDVPERATAAATRKNMLVEG